VEAGDNGVVDLLCRPAAEMSAAMQEDFEQADDAGLVDLEAGIANRTNDRAPPRTVAISRAQMPVGSVCTGSSHTWSHVFSGASKPFYLGSLDLGTAEASCGTVDRRGPAWIRRRSEFAVAPYLQEHDPANQRIP
jgi:hypothetical protein